MKTIKFLFTLLNKKEKLKIPYVSFFILLNTLLEVISIGILIPLVSIFINNENKFFFGINPNNYLAHHAQCRLQNLGKLPLIQCAFLGT